jgi:hypothetical protein
MILLRFALRDRLDGLDPSIDLIPRETRISERALRAAKQTTDRQAPPRPPPPTHVLSNLRREPSARLCSARYRYGVDPRSADAQPSNKPLAVGALNHSRAETASGVARLPPIISLDAPLASKATACAVARSAAEMA